MPGISSMLPKGGDAVWGNLTWAPDDREGQTASFGNFLRFTKANATTEEGNMTVTESLEYLLRNSNDWFSKQVRKEYSHGVAHTRKEIEVSRRRTLEGQMLSCSRKTKRNRPSG